MAPTRCAKPVGLLPAAAQPGIFPGRIPYENQGPVGALSTHPDHPDAYVRELQELGLDLFHMGLDLVGFVDPTPVSDGASSLLALARGQWMDAAISGLSIVPYIGDLAKAGKLPRYLSCIERAVELAEKSPKAAEILVPGLRRIREALHLLPSGANRQIDRMREIVDHFLAKYIAPVSLQRLPDISSSFKFSTRIVVRNGKKFHVKKVSGRLGVPGKVKSHREDSSKLQRKVSSGSGDDAGHLIGDQFGAPPGNLNLPRSDAPLQAENLSRQNWIQNQGGGTFHDLESTWARQLEDGIGIEVTVQDYFPKGSNRPSFRSVEWTEIHPDGHVVPQRLDFMNAHTADANHRSGSRTQQNVPPTVDSPQTDNVIPVDFKNRRKKQ